MENIKNMKNILKLSAIIMAVCLSSMSCNKFLDRNPSDMVPMDEAIVDADGVVTATMGVYTEMRGTGYYGCAFTMVNDLAADISTKKHVSPPNGHYDEMENYSLNESSEPIANMWTAMYSTINRASRVIEAGKNILKGTVSDADKKRINACIAQCYGAKALTMFNLVNMYALPYRPATAESELGVPNVDDKIIDANTNSADIKRATVKQNYDQVLKDLKSAKDYWLLAENVVVLSSGSSWMTINNLAVYAIEARVHLYMREYGEAISDVNKVLAEMKSREITLDPAAYKLIWTKNEESKEDIFTLSIKETESLGVNSIGHMYGPAGHTYGARLCVSIVDNMFTNTDIRIGIIERDTATDFAGDCYRLAKYNGPRYGQISNIPVIRLPELYLILAECENELGNLIPARTALFEVAKRDTALKTVEDLETNTLDQIACRQFIQEERVRELMLEGHRWMDMRRYGLELNKNRNNNNIDFTAPFDIQTFAFPIPIGEINVTGLQQNKWDLNLPKVK